MAYKFQLDSAILSGALVQEGAGEFVGNLSSTAVISGSGNALVGGSLTVGQSKFVVHATSGLVTGVGLNNTAGGITNAGSIAGATSIDGSGDLTMGTITMTGFSVDADGDTTVKTLGGATTISGSGLGSFGGGLAAGQGSFAVSSAGAIAGATTVSGSGLAQFGQVRSDGGLTMQGSTIISTSKAVSNVTSVDGSGDLTMGTITMTGFSVDADGDTIVKTLGGATTISGSGLGSFGGGLAAGQGSFTVSSTGAIAGATSIDASGDLTVASITNAEFTVDASGNTDIDGTLNVEGVPTFQAGAVFSAGVTTANAIAGATTITGSGLLTMNDLSITQTSLLAGDIALSGASDTAIAVAADSLYFLDATSGKVRRDTFADYAAALVASEPGLSSSGGKLQYDPNSLASASVNVAQDFFSFVDADNLNIPKKDSIADLVTAMAGGGLNATNGVLSTQGGSVTAGGDGVTLAEGYNYFTGTVNASCTLPGDPSVGDVVTIKAGNTTAGQKITINRAGSHLIDNNATKIELESPYAAVTLVYVVANDWRLV